MFLSGCALQTHNLHFWPHIFTNKKEGNCWTSSSIESHRLLIYQSQLMQDAYLPGSIHGWPSLQEPCLKRKWTATTWKQTIRETKLFIMKDTNLKFSWPLALTPMATVGTFLMPPPARQGLLSNWKLWTPEYLPLNLGAFHKVSWPSTGKKKKKKIKFASL